MKALAAIRELMQRTDNIAPNGGRKITFEELKAFRDALMLGELSALGREACELLGESFEDVVPSEVG